VIKGDKPVTIIFADGKTELEATPVFSDATADLSVLKLKERARSSCWR